MKRKSSIAGTQIAGAAYVLIIGATLFTVTLSQPLSPDKLRQPLVIKTTYVTEQPLTSGSLHPSIRGN